MKTLAFALALAAACLAPACATGGSSSAKGPAKPAYDVKDPVRLALQPVSIPPELEGVPGPSVFEQMLCNKLFELNKKQVICSDEVKVFIENKRQALMLGADGSGSSVEALLESLDAPRRVSLVAAKAGEALVAMTVIVQTKGGKTLERLQFNLKADGGDVLDRVNEAALQIVKIPPEPGEPVSNPAP